MTAFSDFAGPALCVCGRPPYSNGRAPAVDSEFGAMNETGTIRRQKHDGLRNLVRCRWTARWRLGGQLLKPLPHGLRAFRARRPRAHGIDADTARAIFRRPRFGQQVDGGLARAIEASPSKVLSFLVTLS